jgi:error-prone DNA polymerase
MSPLQRMDTEERLVADFHGTGMTVGPHPMAYRREELRQMGIKSAAELQEIAEQQACGCGGCRDNTAAPRNRKGPHFLDA